jgi:hypothetical protein
VSAVPDVSDVSDVSLGARAAGAAQTPSRRRNVPDLIGGVGRIRAAHAMLDLPPMSESAT